MGRKPLIEPNSRTTLFIKDGTIKKLDLIASKTHIETGTKVSRTDLVNEALEQYIQKWEKKNGPIPTKK